MGRQSLPSFLADYEREHAVKFYYLEDWITLFHVDERFNGYTLRHMLDELLANSDVSYEFQFGYAVIFTKDPSSAMKREVAINNALVQRKTVERRILGDKMNYTPGRTLTLRGTVRDQDAGHPLANVAITVHDAREEVTGPSGQYQLKLLPGEYVITFRYDNYDDRIVDLSIYDDGVVDVSLQESPIILEEVVISDETLQNSIGRSTISVSQIRRLPTFLGEVDIIKQVQSQPGVTTVGEVAAGFNVRGGGADQNLVLFDDIPVFNSSHALGFFTAFNADAVSEIRFYRGGIPAQFGGRVSSVLDITSRQGDYQQWKGSGGIGIISSYFTAGGPIKKDTTSLLVSMRASYSDWMLKAIRSNYQDIRNSSVMFYDGVVKLSHRINNKGKLTFSGYASHDRFSLTSDTTYYWRNLGAAVRYDHPLSDRVFSSFSLVYGKYEFRVGEATPATAFDMRYTISHPALKMDFQVEGKHKIVFGLHNTCYEFHPGRLQPRSATSNARSIEMPAERALETALYISDGFDLGGKLFVEGGIRYSLFNRFGPTTVYYYRTGAPRDVYNIVDSTRYEGNAISATYHAPEPRLSLRYQAGERTSLKAGYNRMVQYLHLITNSAAITPTDIWQSSNAYFRPQVADQVSAGLFKNLSNDRYETFVEAYYKKVRNVLDFKEGADLVLNRNLEADLVRGTGTSYGVEFSVTRLKGRLIGSLNYTFSRSVRRTQSEFVSERINDGRTYPSNFDQPHIVNLTWRYAFSRRLFFSGNFNYHTGRPVSLPATLYPVDRVPVSAFSGRNQYRIPDYHRLDIAFVVEGNHKRKKWWDGNWIFSFYNLYARRNAYSVFFARDNKGFLKPYRLTVIGTVIPSISYSFKF